MHYPPVPEQSPSAAERQTHAGAGLQPANGPVRVWGLIPCAGQGSRAAAPVAKQYRVVAGQPLVLHTIAAFAKVPRIEQTLVIVAHGDSFLQTCDNPHPGRWSVRACGGAHRAGSVANGLAALRELGAQADDWVLVHDAARCLVTPALIEHLISACWQDPVGGLLAHPVTDTLKRAHDGRVVATPPRSLHWLAQTPQMFRCEMLRHALAVGGEQATDESSAIELLGLSPLLVQGDAANFKVTFATDFAIAQAILLQRAGSRSREMDYDYP